MSRDEYDVMRDIAQALNRLAESVAIIAEIAARKDEENRALGNPIGD